MKLARWERYMFSICGLGLILLTIFFPEKNIPLDLFFGGLGFVYLIYAIVAKER